MKVFSIIFAVILLVSCDKKDYNRPVYYQAAYTFPKCVVYEPSKIVLKISTSTYILDAYKIPGGIKSSNFILSPGSYIIEDVYVLDEAENKILWTPKNIDHELVVIFTPYTQKIEVGQKMLSGQLDCNLKN